MKRLKYGGYAGITTFVVIVAAVVLNLLAQQIGWQIDLTDTAVFTLSPQTRATVDGLTDDVTIYILASRQPVNAQVMEVLDRYARSSNRIRLETVDPEQSPGIVARFDPDGRGIETGSVIVATQQAFRAIRRADLFSQDTTNPNAPQIVGLDVERRITSALAFLAGGQTPIVYQTQGHGEVDLSTAGGGRLGEQFRASNLELRRLNLIQAAEIPSDTAILSIVRPQSDFSPSEIAKVERFLSRGGKLFLAIELAAGELPNLSLLLERYGIGIPAAVVLEPDRNFNIGQPLQLAPQLSDSPITTPLVEANFSVVTPLARPVQELSTRPRGITFDALLTTSGQSFYRSDLANESLSMVPGDVRGPVAVAAKAVERDFVTNEEISRIVVVGNVSFIALVDQVSGNLDFLLNSFGWLEPQGQILSIRSRSTFRFPMQMTGMQQLVFAVLFVVVIPAAILITGFVTWLRRRYL